MRYDKSISFSVITVCYNSERFIKHTIESVNSQKNVSFEHIVIDGLSTDGTGRILDMYRGQISVISEDDSGIYDAMNKGIKIATGQWICFLNSDDFFTDEFALYRLAQKIKSKKKHLIFFNDVRIVSRLDEKVPIRDYTFPDDVESGLKNGVMPPHPGAVCHRSLFRHVGIFDERFSIAGDYDWFFRAIVLSKVNYVITRQVLVVMRNGGVSSNGLISYLKISAEIFLILFRRGLYLRSVISVFRGGAKLMDRFRLK